MNFSIFSKIKLSKAFTLVELIVVIAIATAIMTALVIQQGSWNDSLAVKTQAYEMVLMIRQAQIFSLGVREDTAGTGDKFNIGYGIHLDTTGNPADRYKFFADRNGNKKYDSGEEIEEKILTRKVKMEKVCASTCPGMLKQVDITFIRPLPNANFVFMKANEDPLDYLSPPASITLISPNGQEVIVKVEANGQISIQ